MNSSPTTPAGTGSIRPSSTKIPTLGRGRPTGRLLQRSDASSPAPIRSVVEVTEVSVRPKTWTSGTPVPAQARSRSGSTRSPPTITVRTHSGRRPPSSASSRAHSCQNAVGSSSRVTPCSARVRASSTVEPSSSRSGKTTAAPESQAGKISSTITSKLGEANWRKRSSVPSPSSAAMAVA